MANTVKKGPNPGSFLFVFIADDPATGVFLKQRKHDVDWVLAEYNGKLLTWKMLDMGPFIGDMEFVPRIEFAMNSDDCLF